MDTIMWTVLWIICSVVSGGIVRGSFHLYVLRNIPTSKDVFIGWQKRNKSIIRVVYFLGPLGLPVAIIIALAYYGGIYFLFRTPVYLTESQI